MVKSLGNNISAIELLVHLYGTCIKYSWCDEWFI